MIKSILLHLSIAMLTMMGDTSTIAINNVMRQEGGFVNHANDPGGATNYGISLRLLKLMGVDIDFDGDTDIDDILALDEMDAREIYRKEWWDKYGYNRINDPHVATMVLSLSVNMGAKQAHKIIQRSVNSMMKVPPLLEDGIFGEKTVIWVNNASDVDEHLFFYHVRTNAIIFYQSIIQKNKGLAVFAKGWENRVNEVTRPYHTIR